MNIKQIEQLNVRIVYFELYLMSVEPRTWCSGTMSLTFIKSLC